MFSDTQEEWLDFLLGLQGEGDNILKEKPHWQCLSHVQCTNIP